MSTPSSCLGAALLQPAVFVQHHHGWPRLRAAPCSSLPLHLLHTATLSISVPSGPPALAQGLIELN